MLPTVALESSTPERRRNRRPDIRPALQRLRLTALADQSGPELRGSLLCIARLAERRGADSNHHMYRVANISAKLAEKCGLPESFCEELRASALFHDIGKLEIDPLVLEKPGQLTGAERRRMDLHSTYGHAILCLWSSYGLAAEIALYHHEKWDGTGYPRGLKGEDIPISARLVQIADVYDALRSRRPYKEPASHEEACRVVTMGDHRIAPRQHFDPRLIELFGDHQELIGQIWAAPSTNGERPGPM